VFATVADISARKGLEEQLLQAQKMESIGRLAGGVAHDFNNMLTAVGGYSALLLADLPTGSDQRSSVEAIKSAADRATALTQQLLAFSRRQVLQPEEVDLNEIVRAVEPMLRPLIGERISLVTALDPRAGRIRADPTQLDQIIVNLAVNALDAMPDGGTVTIETGNAHFEQAYAIEHFDVAPGSYVMLAVTDTGMGMDRETRQHIFEPFFTTKERGQGTGLGLATIYGIVTQSGGHIWLYSEPARGTSFKVYFPRVGAPDTTGADGPSNVAMSTRVLLVEDEETVRDFTRHAWSATDTRSSPRPTVRWHSTSRAAIPDRSTRSSPTSSCPACRARRWPRGFANYDPGCRSCWSLATRPKRSTRAPGWEPGWRS